MSHRSRSNSIVDGPAPFEAGTWNRSNVAAYGDVEVNDVNGDWTLGGALRVERFEDFW